MTEKQTTLLIYGLLYSVLIFLLIYSLLQGSYDIGMTMKYQVIYIKNKKNKQSKQVATFYTIEDASLWEKHIKQQGYTQSEIVPVL